MSALELRGPFEGLLDEPLALSVRGAGSGADVRWRARYRDDDGRIWRAGAADCSQLLDWLPAKEGTGDVAALRSLRPVIVEVRAEAADGRAASRELTRVIAAAGVRRRRWRDGLAATLHVPAGSAPCATVILDVTGGPSWGAVAASLLASRGAIVLAVGPTTSPPTAASIAATRELLLAVPGATEPILLSAAPEPADDAVAMPPNVGARGTRESVRARALAWDALLARLGARPRADSYCTDTASPTATDPPSSTSP